MRSLVSVVVSLLQDLPNPPAEARGRFALATAKLPNFGMLLLRVMHIPWLGPGLVLALLLLATLRGTRRTSRKPLQRIVHAPKLERYRGTIPRRHRDLEI